MTGQTRSDGLARLLRPRHIAVFGGRFAAEVIRQSERIGFTGDIWPVNPERAELGGRRCFRDVAALPHAPDASFIAVAREATIEIVKSLAARGAGGAVCYAAGFAEAGNEGAALQRALVEAAGSLAVVGPNCYGVLNYLDGATLWPDVHGGVGAEQGAAIITQSGNVGISLTMQQRSLPLAYLISVGNQAVLTVADFIEALVGDPRIKAIGIHIESVDDIERFSRAAIAAHERRVPLVALKVGSSQLGARAALSHTSSLVGNDILYDALFKRLRIARVQSLAELVETLKLLAVSGAIAGRSIASISCSGGEAALVADAAEASRMIMPAFNAIQERKLRAILGPMVHVANPLDYHTFIWGNPDAQRACFTAVLGGEQHITLKVIDYPSPEIGDTRDWDNTISALIDAARTAPGRVAALCTLPENFPRPVREKLLANGITPLQGLREGMCAVKAAMDFGEWFVDATELLPVTVFDAAAGDIEILGEWQAKMHLQRFGVQVPNGRISDPDSLLAAADAIGYPVVLKSAVAGIAHKSDVGGVRLNVCDGAELRRAAESLKALGDRFLIEAMVQASVAELLVGVIRDPQYGLALTIGAGGAMVELIADSRTLLFPVSRDAVSEALDTLRISKLLDGYRGGPRGDRSAAIDAILGVAAYAEANAACIEELDVNPLMVLAEGRGAVAVDALIRLRKGGLE